MTTPVMDGEDAMAVPFRRFPGEEDLLVSRPANLRVTTHRVRWDEQVWGRGHIHSIPIQEIDSCQSHHTSHPWLIVLAVLIVLATTGIFAFDQQQTPPRLRTEVGLGIVIGGPVIALLLISAYLGSRRHFLVIASGNSALTLNVAGISTNDVRDIIDTIEEAKHDYETRSGRR
jgi:hypothetical protein